MAKKIRFPLEMKDGAQARTLAELKEHWDVEKIVAHFSSGKLMTWLRDRPYENERAQVEALEEKDAELRQKLSAIFGMEYAVGENAAEDVETVRDRQERLNRLRQATTDKEILADVDHAAFDQDDLWDIVDTGAKKVYLVNNTFEISLTDRDMTYIGVGKALVKIDSQEPVDFEALGIRFENVQFDEKYEKISNPKTQAEDFYSKGKAAEEAEDFEKAVDYYKKAAEVGNASAMYQIGLCYDVGSGVEESKEKSFEWYLKAANNGNADAMEQLGFHYQIVEEDDEKAFEWYQKAADGGNSSAMCSLGTYYQFGGGVEKDFDKAIEWYQKAAEAGDTAAMCNLGDIYFDEEYEGHNEKNAAEWYQKAADAENSDAMWKLGKLYEYGTGVVQDSGKALAWYRKSAEADDNNGMLWLGYAYRDGVGTPQNLKKAAHWFRKSAEAGNEHGEQELHNLRQDSAAAQNNDWYRDPDFLKEFLFRLQESIIPFNMNTPGGFLSVYSCEFSFNERISPNHDIFEDIPKYEENRIVLAALEDRHPFSCGGIAFTEKAMYVHHLSSNGYVFMPYSVIKDIYISGRTLKISTNDGKTIDVNCDVWNPQTIKLFLSVASGINDFNSTEMGILHDLKIGALGNKTVGEMING